MIDNSKYEIRLADYRDQKLLAQLVNLQNESYAGTGHHFCAESFRHWYLDNPDGQAISFNAFRDDLMAAHYACVPIVMVIDGNKTRGLLSMATVTHPKHRGNGLFTLLASQTYDYAAENGYNFVIGVANANSIHGFLKYLGFYFVAQLDVKIGIGSDIVKLTKSKTFSRFWNKETLSWRTEGNHYYIHDDFVASGLQFRGIRKLPVVRAILGGGFNCDVFSHLPLQEKRDYLHPLNLYIGRGADLSNGHYVNFPKFIKRSPFNLIFKDLTKGRHLPTMTKENVFFQLIDFDVL